MLVIGLSPLRGPGHPIGLSDGPMGGVQRCAKVRARGARQCDCLGHPVSESRAKSPRLSRLRWRLQTVQTPAKNCGFVTRQFAGKRS